MSNESFPSGLSLEFTCKSILVFGSVHSGLTRLSGRFGRFLIGSSVYLPVFRRLSVFNYFSWSEYNEKYKNTFYIVNNNKQSYRF